MPADRALALVLHAHLPWCKGEPDAEAWLVEAAIGCYLPLYEVLRGLEEEGIAAPLALSFSPPLVAMLDDPALRGQVRAALEAKAAGDGASAALRFHRSRAALMLERFLALDEDLPGAFLALSRRGALELFGCAATHGYLPLLAQVPEAARAQVLLGASLYRRRFGAAPPGLWLPECGYTPKAAGWLAESGARWTVLDGPQVEARGHAFLSTGVAVLIRDTARCAEVWNAEIGFPGHADYLDFHHRADGARVFRVTGPGQKAPWDPERGLAQARAHAQQFYDSLCAGRPGLTVAAFDAELFGHWWFEGPEFLSALWRRCAGSGIEAVTPTAWLRANPEGELVDPHSSSWGKGGFHATWLNEANQRLWPLQLRAAERMVALAQHAGAGRDAVLSRLAVELLLAQASDWPFLLDAQASTALAARRVEGHLSTFFRCADAALGGDWGPATALAQAHNPLGQVDVRVYRAARG